MRLLTPDRLLLRKLCHWANTPDVIGELQRPYGWSARALSRSATRTWIIAHGRWHVGFCYAQPQRFGTTEIGVTLLPEFRGQRLGTRAHELLLREARTGGTRAFQAITAETNAVERRILDTLGFDLRDDVEVPEMPHRLLVYRRIVHRAHSPKHVVVVVLGPAGVGKSSLCLALKPLLRESPELSTATILSIWGDMFSHLSYPWAADDVQIARKYRAMTNVLRDLLREEKRAVILIDDLVRSTTDLLSLCAFVEARGGACLVLGLDADDVQLLQRNTERYETEVLPDETVLALAAHSRRIIAEASERIGVATIDNRAALPDVADRIRSLIVARYRRNR